MTQASALASPSEAEWRAAAVQSLGGAPFETLISRAADGVELQPVYTRRQGPRALRGEHGWRNLARLDHPDPRSANEQTLVDLANGANGLQVVFAGAAGAYGYGLAKHDPAALQMAFDGVRFDSGARFELDLGPAGALQAAAFAALVTRAGADPAAVDIAFGLDPVGALARSGRAEQAWPAEAAALTKSVGALQARGFAGPFVAADARIVHAAGGSPAQELSFALATALAYLRALTDHGFAPATAAAAIGFRLAADADQLFTLAKFRALRLLWGRVREVCGLDAAPARLHAETAWRSLSARAPYVNAMRGAGAAFAAGLGGADSVAVLPFTLALGLPDAAARRLARNCQHILLDEAHLGHVADPAAGAGVFESLTATLCDKGWSGMQALERSGGVALALREGAFQRAVAAERAKLAEGAARFEMLLTGVNAHADLAERAVDTLPAEPPVFAFAGEAVAEPLRPERIAVPFERLRAASDLALAREGARPRLFLAALGPGAQASRALAFAREAFEAGGFETIVGAHARTPADAAVQFAASGARLVCLCGDDAAQGAAFARAFKGAGARWLILAGAPGARAADWREAGVDDFIPPSADMLAALQRMWAQLSVSADARHS